MTPEVEARFKRIDEHLEQTARYLDSIDARLRGSMTEKKNDTLVQAIAALEQATAKLELAEAEWDKSRVEVNECLKTIKEHLNGIVDTLKGITAAFENGLKGLKPKEEA